jgi:hypothetical protein
MLHSVKSGMPPNVTNQSPAKPPSKPRLMFPLTTQQLSQRIVKGMSAGTGCSSSNELPSNCALNRGPRRCTVTESLSWRAVTF